MEACIAWGGCYQENMVPVPENAYEIVVDGTTFTLWPDVPEYTVDMQTLYDMGELKRPTSEEFK